MNPSVVGPEKFVLAQSGTCLYHCKGETRPHPIAGSHGPIAWVYTCPGGTVSTVAFVGGSRRPSPSRVQRYLQSRLARPERIRPRDLRAATRHGPEMGRAAQRWIGGPGAGQPIRLLYWRRYPKKMGRRYSYLYACFRHGPGEVRFYPGQGSLHAGQCPFCVGKI
jgi:hypothetical protein